MRLVKCSACVHVDGGGTYRRCFGILPDSNGYTGPFWVGSGVVCIYPTFQAWRGC
jgi:hypothetical protein